MEIYSKEEWFWLFEPSLNLEATFCKFWTSIKIKFSMICVYKEYEVEIKMVQKWLKKRFLLGCNLL